MNDVISVSEVWPYYHKQNSGSFDQATLRWLIDNTEVGARGEPRPRNPFIHLGRHRRNRVLKNPWPSEDKEDQQANAIAQANFTTLGLGEGRWPEELKHLRNYSWTNESFVDSMTYVVDTLGIHCAMKLFAVKGFVLRITEPLFQASFDRFDKQVGPDNAVKLFSTDSFCTRCEDPSFLNKIDRFAKQVGPDTHSKYRIRAYTHI